MARTKRVTARLKVTGMTCATCARSVRAALMGLHGVQDVSVDAGTEVARVAFLEGTIDGKRLYDAVAAAGYGLETVDVDIRIGGMTCAMCSQAIGDALKRLSGVLDATVNLGTETARISFLPGMTSVDDMKRTVIGMGYRYLGVAGDEMPSGEDEVKRSQRSRLVRIALGFSLSIPMLVMMQTAMHMPINMSYLFMALTTPALIFIAFPIFKAAFRSLRNLRLTMDVMYAMGISVAYTSSAMGTFGLVLDGRFMFFDTTLMLASFLTLGRYLETMAKGRTSGSVRKLMGLRPRKALRYSGGGWSPVSIDDVEVGDRLLARPGERIPVDGIVIKGNGYVDESMLTGEPMPNRKGPGSRVISGTLNKDSALELRTEKVGQDTMLSQIVRMVMDAQTSRPALQKMADRIVAFFIPLVLFVAFASFLFWSVIMGEPLLFSLTALISVLVIACPCALGLASPTAITVGIGRGAELGILIKGGEVLERSGKIDTVVMDKTGTLTSGKPQMTRTMSFGTDEDRLLRHALALAALSDHPVSKAIQEASVMKGIPVEPCDDLVSLGGKGLSGKVGGETVLVGNRRLLEDEGVILGQSEAAEVDSLEREGVTVTLVSIAGKVAGVLGVEDPLREGAMEAVTDLKGLGLRVIMMTGDNPRAARTVASRIGIEEVIAEVLPGEKADRIRELQESGRKVAFIGDGINDAPALARADIGIAMGTGTDIAIESGGIVLVKGDPRDAVAGIRLSRKVMGRVRQNLFWALAYNSALIPVAAGATHPLGLDFRPEWGALAMALSSVTVISLSLLLKRYDPRNMGSREGKNTAIDPVCRMRIDPHTSRWRSIYEGRTYHFCAPGCKHAFDAEPARYLGS